MNIIIYQLLMRSKIWMQVCVLLIFALSGCATTPRSWLAPVEDHSAKAPRRTVAPSAQALPLAELAEDAPLRAEPLPPRIVPELSSSPQVAMVDQSFAPITKKGNESALPLPPKLVNETVRPPMTQPASPLLPPATPTQTLPTPPVPAPPKSPLVQQPPKITPPAVVNPVVAPNPSPAPPIAIQPQPAPKPSRPSSSNTGVVALLDKADDFAASGQVDSAAVTLERALKIEPENGRLWYELASIRLKQGRVDSAVSLAEKSNSLARNQRDLQARNWRLIAVARKKQGQDQASTEALGRARSLESSNP